MKEKVKARIFRAADHGKTDAVISDILGGRKRFKKPPDVVLEDICIGDCVYFYDEDKGFVRRSEAIKHTDGVVVDCAQGTVWLRSVVWVERPGDKRKIPESIRMATREGI